MQHLIKLICKTKALVYLDISNNDLSQEGCKELLDTMTHQQSIIHLDLGNSEGLRRNRLSEMGALAAKSLLTHNNILEILNL